MASKKEPKRQRYLLHVDFMVNGQIVKKCKMDKTCTQAEARTEYTNWKFVREQWNGTDIQGITLATEDRIVYEKYYEQYDKDKVILEEQK